MSADRLAGQTPESVQAEIGDTRDHLSEQVHALGHKVVEMAHDANEAVSDAIRGGTDAAHAVRDAVRHASTDAMAYFKRALDCRAHVRRHPWLAIGCAVALGLACGGFLRRGTHNLSR